ncbi:helix-turn-helix domain-containing protein [Enterococcus sp. LJL99]
MVELPLSEYIRNRKFNNAGFELLDSQNKIIDIALKYSYASPTSFNRVFQSVHGFPPSKVKENQKELVVYPRIRLAITVSGDKSIRYRVEEKKEMMFLGKRYTLSEKIETNFQKVPLFWQDFSATNEIATIGSHKECLENRLYGITLYQEEETHSYLIGLETKGRILQTKYEQFVIGAQT